MFMSCDDGSAIYLLSHYTPIYFQMIFCFCEHRHTHTHTRTHVSAFSVYFLWSHIAQAWKLKNIPLPYQPVETFLTTVPSNHNRQWVNISVWEDFPTLLSCQWGIKFPADFSIRPYHSWKPVSKEVNGKMWKRSLPEHGDRGLIWSSGSPMGPGVKACCLVLNFVTSFV